eukprot:364872-Chlamydomonas_euryale.AAC.5
MSNALALRIFPACALQDPSNPNFWSRVDPRYIACNGGVSFAADTKLGMTAEEDRAWRDRIASSMQTRCACVSRV